jgi:hypothetical protein
MHLVFAYPSRGSIVQRPFEYPLARLVELKVAPLRVLERVGDVLGVRSSRASSAQIVQTRERERGTMGEQLARIWVGQPDRGEGEGLAHGIDRRLNEDRVAHLAGPSDEAARAMELRVIHE